MSRRRRSPEYQQQYQAAQQAPKTPDAWDRFDQYASLTDALNAAQATAEWQRKGFAQAEHNRARGTWSGGTHEDTEHLVTHGWTEGVTKAKEYATRVVDRMVNHSEAAIATEITPDVIGCGYDVGAYISGVPECWMRIEPTIVRRAIHICAEIGCSAAIDPGLIMQRGIAVASLALALNAAGYPVTIDVSHTSLNPGNSREARIIRIADAASGSPLDLDRVVYAMAHPTMLRIIDRCLTAGDRPNGGDHWDSGQTLNVPPTETRYDLYLAGMSYAEQERWTAPEQWIMQEYLKQTAA